MAALGDVELKENVHPYARNHYRPVPDARSNVSRFQIIDSTLREGEQFVNAWFSTKKRIEIARALDDFGVDYIELTSPTTSQQSRKDCEAICKLGLKAKVLAHIRCHIDDAREAVRIGVDGINVVIGTSPHLQQHSHGRSIESIQAAAIEVIEFVKTNDIEVRFSSEDSFRSDLVDLLALYAAVDKIGVNRIGIADTVGCASPRQVYDLVRTVRDIFHCDIETHFHDDCGYAIANASCALEAGATHIDTCVLGIGERNGITPLGGLMACMVTADRDHVLSKYKLEKLRDLELLVAQAVRIGIPFNNYITGSHTFAYKDMFADACLGPSLAPADFGLKICGRGFRGDGKKLVCNDPPPEDKMVARKSRRESRALEGQVLVEVNPLPVEKVRMG